MTKTVTVHEAKTNLSKLLVQVQAGEDVVIAKGRDPVARLVSIKPPAAPKRRVPGRLKGLIAIDERFFEPLPDEELARWDGDAD
jgi:prevent-host-death family protein